MTLPLVGNDRPSHSLMVVNKLLIGAKLFFDRVNPTNSWSSWKRDSHKCFPINPEAPDIKIFIITIDLLSYLHFKYDKGWAGTILTRFVFIAITLFYCPMTFYTRLESLWNYLYPKAPYRAWSNSSQLSKTLSMVNLLSSINFVTLSIKYKQAQ